MLSDIRTDSPENWRAKSVGATDAIEVVPDALAGLVAAGGDLLGIFVVGRRDDQLELILEALSDAVPDRQRVGHSDEPRRGDVVGLHRTIDGGIEDALVTVDEVCQPRQFIVAVAARAPVPK